MGDADLASIGAVLFLICACLGSILRCIRCMQLCGGDDEETKTARRNRANQEAPFVGMQSFFALIALY